MCLVLIILLSGCGKKQNPAYFDEVLKIWEEQDQEGRVYNLNREKSLAYELERAEITAEDQYKLELIKVRLPDGRVIENIDIDLKEYVRSQYSAWVMDSIFYVEERGKIYVIINSFPNGGEPGSAAIIDEEIPCYMIVSFSPENPKDYEIEAFDNASWGSGFWFTQTCLIDDTFYEYGSAGNAPVAVRLDTMEMRDCTEEWEKVEEAAADFIENYRGEERAGVCYVSPIGKVDDAVIFAGSVSEAMDTPTLFSVYIASRDGEIVDVMTIDDETKQVTFP